jgi:hypothetical protein
MPHGAILLKPVVTLILLQQLNELGYDILVYFPVNCILEETGFHHILMRDSTPYSNFFRMQGQFLEDMWMFTTPHPTLLSVSITAKVKQWSVTKENIIQYVYSIFLDKFMNSPTIT